MSNISFRERMTVTAIALAICGATVLLGSQAAGSAVGHHALPVPSGDLGEVVVTVPRETAQLGALPMPIGDLGEVVVTAPRETAQLAALPVPSGDLGEVVVVASSTLADSELDTTPTALIAQR